MRRLAGIFLAGILISVSLTGCGDTTPSVSSPGNTPTPSSQQIVVTAQATSTNVASNPGDDFVSWAGAISQELRICGLAAHQLTWTHTDTKVTDVFSMAATPTDGCNFAADNISYDTLPNGLPDSTLTSARDKLVKWARMLAAAYRGDNPSTNLLDQAEQVKTDGLRVIVQEADKLLCWLVNVSVRQV